MENVCKDNPSSAEFSEDFVEILPVFQIWDVITFLFEKIYQKWYDWIVGLFASYQMQKEYLKSDKE